MRRMNNLSIKATWNNESNDVIKSSSHYTDIGKSIGKLVDEKNKAYGDSFNKSSDFLKLLYPNGVSPEQYADMLGIIRVFDKLMRIANSKNAFGEDPWKDIVGYGLLRSDIDESNHSNQ